MVLEPLLASFRGATQEGGLHHLSLPTGPVVYFLCQRGLTLVACFSGPPRRVQLDDGLGLLEQQKTPAEDLLRDLPPDVAALVATLLNAPVERDLLIHWLKYSRMAMTAPELARHVGCSEDEVVTALANLEQLALIRRIGAGDMTFYRLTSDEALRTRLDQFITWRGHWLRRAHRVEQLVGPRN
jgi:hypothetical protein